jgi:hypothetical protein
MAIMTSLPEDLREICALLDAHHWFGLADGPESPQMKEAFELLISSERRSALKKWYARLPVTEETENSLRRIIERAVGEKIPLENQEVKPK